MKAKKKLTREVDCGESKGGAQVEKIGGKGEEKGERGVERRKPGPAPKLISEDAQKKILRGLRLGIPLERLVPLAGYSGVAGGWLAYCGRHPEWVKAMELARSEGELELVGTVADAANGWQGSAWVLERTRGYVARQQLEHSGPGGKALTIAPPSTCGGSTRREGLNNNDYIQNQYKPPKPEASQYQQVSGNSGLQDGVSVGVRV